MAGSPPPSQEDDSLYLHAELLPNIRHITLYISLPARVASDGLQISLSESRRAVSVSLPGPQHDLSETMKLPARVSEASRRALSAGAAGREGHAGADGRREYSFRMQVDDGEETLAGTDELTGGFVPWTARDLSPVTRLRCLQCERVVLEGDKDKHNQAGWVWKDLPSGNWAEMMDFWHCHKPDPPPGEAQSEDPNAVVKGYGAANQVVATPGTVLVDVATFLVADTDCKGLMQVQSGDADGSSQPDTVTCVNCDSSVGVEDTVAHGWRLFKTSFAANVEGEAVPESAWESHSTETVVAAQLLEFIERESARRFVVHCGCKDGILIWVFNPDLRYSNSSAHHSIAAQRAMKVFFQRLDDADATLHPDRGKASSLSLEELKLPTASFAALTAALDGSNAMLPVSAREFREWKVGILHRFERPSVQQT
ncbi:hypothetical protein BO70DRAFT_392075 [Aspergillus heteromorphus CBS 117.55]|uniref:Ubiquitin-conjugating enzyme E2-binding protein n=1 Tax=Aspergillus heteromorphus CBS 117.55 TaxID=1448321 RepID=A0A317X740_9EURO|nr:uncharacterized protein BO70DRAFT_392075 [Aspergillus heteromorphus CBS 117.55]PWY92688.1 hypothetical protein BO70DRAFT_392075 [Aspergillus heteromorphus CBS 117.55]